jgi:branched-chain amino acid transport system ATP-binding protein
MLKVEHLDALYGDLQVLWDISLEVNEKEIVALIGSNGAGKTTLIRAIAGLLKSKKGDITYNGVVLNNRSPHEIVKLGISIVPEGRRLFPKMTVLQNLEMGAFLKKARGNREPQINQVYMIFPVLKQRAQQVAGSLSGGEQQMLAIGRALMAQNTFMMLDEMSLGLSPLMVKNIFEIISRINKQGIDILIVEQNVPMTLRVADRAYLLESGRIVGQGDAKSLLKNSHVKEAYLGMRSV